MSRRGPSPLIPSLMVGVLSLVAFWPYILYLVSYIVPSFQAGDEEASVASSFFMLLLPVLLLLLIQFLTAVFSSGARFSPGRNQQRRTSGYDGGGFGMGTLILLVLYFVLYNYM